MGDFSLAISNCNLGLISDPNEAKFYLLRGIAKASLRQFDPAIKDYDHAILLNPKFESAYLNRGAAKTQTGDYFGAVADYSITLNLNSNLSDAYYSRANVQQYLGNYTNAMSDFSLAIKTKTNNVWAYANRAALGLALSGRSDLALADMEQAIRFDPQNPTLYCNRAGMLFRDGKYKEAIADCEKSLKLQPGYYRAYNGLGVFYNDLCQLPLALDNFNKSIAISASQPDVEHRIYLIRMRLGDKEEVKREIMDRCSKLANASKENGIYTPTVDRIEPFLAGLISDSDLLRGATNYVFEKTERNTQYCQACYYIGMKRLMDGNTNGAMAALNESAATQIQFGEVGYEEMQSSKNELDLLKAK